MMKVKKPEQQDIEKTANWGIWEKEPSVFPWQYDEKETCLILEGKASVTDRMGNQIDFQAGDWVEFEAGLECTWHITETIKKRYNFG
jgi:hypothetical protein